MIQFKSSADVAGEISQEIAALRQMLGQVQLGIQALATKTVEVTQKIVKAEEKLVSHMEIWHSFMEGMKKRGSGGA